MRKCRHCGVKLRNDIERCPLCDMQTESMDDVFSEDYPYIRHRFDRRLIIKLVTFCAVVLVVAVLFTDHLVQTGKPWTVLASAGIVYAWVNCVIVLRRTPNPATVILCQLIFGGALSYVVDRCTGYYGWSVDYVIPFLCAGTSIALAVFVMVSPGKYRRYILYQLVLALIGAVLLTLRLLERITLFWSAETAAFVTVISFLTVAVFARRRTGTEFRKRFHF